MRHRLLLLAAPVVLFVASACTPAAAPAAGAALPPAQITVTGTDDFRFSPSTITVKAGQPLEVTFQNGGEILHDFTVTYTNPANGAYQNIVTLHRGETVSPQQLPATFSVDEILG